MQSNMKRRETAIGARQSIAANALGAPDRRSAALASAGVSVIVGSETGAARFPMCGKSHG